MEIKFNVSEQDYINFNIYHFNNSKKMRPTRSMQKYMPVLISFILIFITNKYILSNINPISIFIFISWLVISILWLCSFKKLMDKALEIEVLKYIKGGKSNDFIGDQTLRLLDEYIEESNSSVVSQTKYSSIEKINYSNNTLYIYTGAIKAILVPLSAFEDKEQEKMFLNILSQKTDVDFSNLYN